MDLSFPPCLPLGKDHEQQCISILEQYIASPRFRLHLSWQGRGLQRPEELHHPPRLSHPPSRYWTAIQWPGHHQGIKKTLNGFIEVALLLPILLEGMWGRGHLQVLPGSLSPNPARSSWALHAHSSPVLRYLSARRCRDDDHIPNCSANDFKASLISGLENNQDVHGQREAGPQRVSGLGFDWRLAEGVAGVSASAAFQRV